MKSSIFAAALLTGLATALWAAPAEAGFIVGTSANLVATDVAVSSVFINQTATVGAASQFSGTHNFPTIPVVLNWTARLDANSVTIGLTTSQGAAASGSPRDTFAFTGLSLDAGTNLSGLALVSETNFDAVVSSTGANDFTIGINSWDTRNGPLTATATFALPTAAVPEPAGLALFGIGLGGLGLIRRRRG